MPDVFPILDARPDRADYRDREYRPRLLNLPNRVPSEAHIKRLMPLYSGSNLVLHQGNSGACTGFGLAALIHYLYFRQAIQPMLDEDQASGPVDVALVSARMLYQMAKIYDRWPGADYEGSSCRGALKGWYRHGVCSEEMWPFDPNSADTKQDGWEFNAATRPLGAYYRIDRSSITDLQSAIHETGAIYCSCRIHSGWRAVAQQDESIYKSKIPLHTNTLGGHAFAIVGYNWNGFIVQNSWGAEWGYNGFAILSYRDWLTHGMDAWVASLGSPMIVEATPAELLSGVNLDVRCEEPLNSRIAISAQDDGKTTAESRRRGLPPTFDPARRTIRIGNRGEPVRHRIGDPDGQSSMRAICVHSPLETLARKRKPRIVIVTGDGVSTLSDCLTRFQWLGPCFDDNDLHTIFITWRTGIGLSLKKWLAYAHSIGESRSDAFSQEANDRAFESFCRIHLVNALWTELKRTCDRADQAGGVVRTMPKMFGELAEQLDKPIEIHLIGHSCGALLAGKLLSRLLRLDSPVTVGSVSLVAPACDAQFALRHFASAIEREQIPASKFRLHNLTEVCESRDTFARVYGKSFLYLVSRALEEAHKTPIIGLQRVNDEEPDVRLWHRSRIKYMQRWQEFLHSLAGRRQVEYGPFVAENGQTVFPTHSNLITNKELVERLIRTASGRLKKEISIPPNAHDLAIGQG